MLTNEDTKNKSEEDNFFRMHLQSLMIAFLSMVFGILAGAYGFLTQLNNLGLLPSDGLQRVTGGGGAILTLVIVFWYGNKTWEERRNMSGLALRYLIILAAGALAAAFISASKVYHSREFLEWVSSYENTAVWSYTYNTTRTLQSVISGLFLKGMLSVVIFSFGINYLIPRLNIELGRRSAEAEK